MLLATFYVIGLLADIISTQGMAIVTQGALQMAFRCSRIPDCLLGTLIRTLNGDIILLHQ